MGTVGSALTTTESPALVAVIPFESVALTATVKTPVPETVHVKEDAVLLQGAGRPDQV